MAIIGVSTLLAFNGDALLYLMDSTFNIRPRWMCV